MNHCLQNEVGDCRQQSRREDRRGSLRRLGWWPAVGWMAAAPAAPLRGRGRSRRSLGGAAMACAGYGTSATRYGLSHHHINLLFHRLIINVKHYRFIINVKQIVAHVLLFTIFIIQTQNSSSGQQLSIRLTISISISKPYQVNSIIYRYKTISQMTI